MSAMEERTEESVEAKARVCPVRNVSMLSINSSSKSVKFLPLRRVFAFVDEAVFHLKK